MKKKNKKKEIARTLKKCNKMLHYKSTQHFTKLDGVGPIDNGPSTK